MITTTTSAWGGVFPICDRHPYDPVTVHYVGPHHGWAVVCPRCDSVGWLAFDGTVKVTAAADSDVTASLS